MTTFHAVTPHPLLVQLRRCGRLSGSEVEAVSKEAEAPGASIETLVVARGLVPAHSARAAIVALSRLPDLESLLVERGLLSTDELARLRSEASLERTGLAEHLWRTGTVSPWDLARAIADLHGLPFLDLSAFVADEPLFARFDAGVLQRLNTLPVRQDGERLVLAIDDPSDLGRLDEIRSVFGADLEFVVSPAAHIQRVINNTLEATVTVSPVVPTVTAEGREAQLVSGVVVELLDQVLGRAVRKGASDIHLEPYGPFLKIKIRLDGVLREMGVLEARMASPMIGRIKILARLDISEKRVGQDGRMQLRVDGRAIDLRVSTLPTIYGETAVLRILDKTQLGLDLDNLGMGEREMVLFKRAIAKPYGMVLVAGPTGSGKTTTLYSAVRAIHTPSSKCMTVEDPVEYQMMDVVQVPVNEKQGLTFSGGLRSIVRQDPDRIMVGEIRDLETAKIAVNAALTGHLVLSTIHANDALEALLRLTGLGIGPRDFASSLNLILSQRLVRRACSSCREQLEAIPEEAREILEDLEPHADVRPWVGRGCTVCHRSGYAGRTGIYEVLPFDDEFRELLVSGGSTVRLRVAARSRGLGSLREAAWALVRTGETTLEELGRVTVAS